MAASNLFDMFTQSILQLHNSTLYFLQSKSMDWFLYDNGLCHERVKTFFNSTQHDPSSRQLMDGCFFQQMLRQNVTQENASF